MGMNIPPSALPPLPPSGMGGPVPQGFGPQGLGSQGPNTPPPPVDFSNLGIPGAPPSQPPMVPFAPAQFPGYLPNLSQLPPQAPPSVSMGFDPSQLNGGGGNTPFPDLGGGNTPPLAPNGDPQAPPQQGPPPLPTEGKK
jgi:hypothetical protein